MSARPTMVPAERPVSPMVTPKQAREAVGRARSKESRGSMPCRARGGRPLFLRRRAGRPQLKRDPLGSAALEEVLVRANRTPILSVIIGLLGLSPYAQAQSGLPQPGERLRYWMRPCHGMSRVSPFCGTHSEGILLSLVPDSVHPDSLRLMLRSEALALSVPVRDMVRLERRSGRRSAFWTGAGWGASIGGISGLGVGLILIKPDRKSTR